MKFDFVEISERFEVDVEVLQMYLEKAKKDYDEATPGRAQTKGSAKAELKKVSKASQGLKEILINQANDLESPTETAVARFIWDVDSESEEDTNRMISLVSELNWLIERTENPDVLKINLGLSRVKSEAIRIEFLAEALAIAYIEMNQKLPTCTRNNKTGGFSSAFIDFIEAVLPFFGLTGQASVNRVAESFSQNRPARKWRYDFWLFESRGDFDSGKRQAPMDMSKYK